MRRHSTVNRHFELRLKLLSGYRKSMAAAGIMGYAETDSEDELPSGWEERTTLDGRVYYVSHAERTTQWIHPRTGKRKKLTGDLPPGWSLSQENNVAVFVNESEGRKTYTDPRLAFAVEERDTVDDRPRIRFDASSKALAVLHGIDLSNRVFLITGANTGIGLETGKSLAMHGAHVILLCRSFERAEVARASIRKAKDNAKVDILECDLASLQSVRKCATAFCDMKLPLHCLILNAGICGAPFSLTPDGFESTFQINHLSQFYLVHLLRPKLIDSAPSRVVFVSSESHRQVGAYLGLQSLNLNQITESYLSPRSAEDYWWMSAYNISKLCNILIANLLNRQLQPKSITCNSLHPGNMVCTDISRHSYLLRAAFAAVRVFTKSLQQAASTTVYCAVAPELVEVGGRYFNNCWFCPPSEMAENEAFQRKLWDISVNMIERVMGDDWASLS